MAEAFRLNQSADRSTFEEDGEVWTVRALGKRCGQKRDSDARKNDLTVPELACA